MLFPWTQSAIMNFVFLSVFIKRKYCNFSLLAILFFKLITMIWWLWLFWCILGYIKSLQCVQLERTTLGRMEHRKQMPFLSAATSTDIEQLSPHGVLLIHERCFTFSCHQLFWILHQNILNWEKCLLFFFILKPADNAFLVIVIKISNI